MSTAPSGEAIVHSFRVAAEHEDVVALSALVAPDVVALTDSAGDVIAPTIPLRGPDEVLPEVIAILSLRSGSLVTEQPANASPALVVRQSSRVVAIVSFGIADGRITHLWITRGPQKLQRWNTLP